LRIANFAVELLQLLSTVTAVCWKEEGSEEWQHKEEEYQVQETII